MIFYLKLIILYINIIFIITFYRFKIYWIKKNPFLLFKIFGILSEENPNNSKICDICGFILLSYFKLFINSFIFSPKLYNFLSFSLLSFFKYFVKVFNPLTSSKSDSFPGISFKISSSLSSFFLIYFYPLNILLYFLLLIHQNQ